MLRRPLFWIIFIAVSVAAAIFTFKNFSTAFPLVSIDLQMNRADALRAARSLMEKNGWPPKSFDQAAEFTGAQELQNFIELEGGGKPELGRIIKQRIFALYTWRVRLFKENDPHETLVQFTPEGEPYGFRVKLPDDEKGESKPAEEAKQIAEQTAANDWKIDFSRYQLAESSKEVRTGGRTDHTFVYERQDERIREGRYRVRLVVSGDKLTELNRFVQIPEAFTRRYESMRSTNDAINTADAVVMIAVYILGFCGIGLFFMIRQRWVLWRQPALWGIFIALLLGLQELNSWPLVWMGYDTAVSASGFAFRQLMFAFATFAGFGILLTISFMAAETLSRRAFPQHVQLWKVWSPPASSAKSILGQTMTGYLLVAPFFAYEIVLYFFAQEKLGWWTPSDTIANPNMFANYVPSLSAIAQAAQAGFWEECLFRAAPLATAALIGNKLGKRRLFISVAMVLQALVFAAGHAGYANQPAYARIVELIIPSFVFGGIYLLFGLLPGIVLHFAYDTTWMALPLFVASGTRAHIEQAIVILTVLVPVWVVVANRIRAGQWTEVPDQLRNGAWKPPEIAPVAPTPTQVAAATPLASYVSRALPVAGVIGLALWILASPFHTNAPAVKITRSDAERTAREALAAPALQSIATRGVQLDSSWKALSYVQGQPGEINRFVWQTAGRDRYEKLLGVYVTPPSWIVRFARFQGDVAERAEEYSVYINGEGRVFRVSHELPEAAPGEGLNADKARFTALLALAGMTPVRSPNDRSSLQDFEEVSAKPQKHPSRTDWTFVFKDKRDYGLTRGEPRVSIEIAGDKVVDAFRWVYVPDDWTRNEHARQNLPGILSAICTIIVVAIVVAAAVIGVVHWSRRRPFSSRAFFAVFGFVFLFSVINVLNSWPLLASQASTAQPFELQVGILIIVSMVSRIFMAIGLGLVAGLFAGSIKVRATTTLASCLVYGVSTGLALAAAIAVARRAVPLMSPLWGNLDAAPTFVPFLGAMLGPLGVFFAQTMILLAVLYGLRHRSQAGALWIIVGIAMAGMSPIETVLSWLIVGVTTGLALMIAYNLIFRHQPQLALITVATMVILSMIRDGVQHMFPAALLGSMAGALLVAIAAWLWFRGSIGETA